MAKKCMSCGGSMKMQKGGATKNSATKKPAWGSSSSGKFSYAGAPTKVTYNKGVKTSKITDKAGNTKIVAKKGNKVSSKYITAKQIAEKKANEQNAKLRTVQKRADIIAIQNEKKKGNMSNVPKAVSVKKVNDIKRATEKAKEVKPKSNTSSTNAKGTTTTTYTSASGKKYIKVVTKDGKVYRKEVGKPAAAKPVVKPPVKPPVIKAPVVKPKAKPKTATTKSTPKPVDKVEVKETKEETKVTPETKVNTNTEETVEKLKPKTVQDIDIKPEDIVRTPSTTSEEKPKKKSLLRRIFNKKEKDEMKKGGSVKYKK